MPRWLCPPLLLAAVVSLAPPARADAIAPLMEPCKPPQVAGVRGHREVCLDPAPTDCPPGWLGAVGGGCVLASCADDSSCPSGQRCVEAPICHETRERDLCWSGAPFSPEFMAAPPRECRPDERSYEVATAPCGDGGACGGKCKPGKLCLAPGQRPSASGARSGLASGAQSRPAGTAPGAQGGPAGTAPTRGGCAGCSAAGTPGEAALALLMLAAGLGALAGRRRGA